WPMRRSPTARRAALTTSCEVTPAGLSTSSRPSGVGGAVIGRRFIALDLGEQRLDARGALDGLVEAEAQFRRELQAQRAADAAPQVRCHAGQRLEGAGLGGLVPHDAHVDGRVAQVAGHLDRRHRDEARDARVLRVAGEERRDLLTYRLADAVGAARIPWWHRPSAVSRRSAGRSRLERTGDFFGAVDLDEIADLEVVEVLDADTALVAFLDFLDVVLE